MFLCMHPAPYIHADKCTNGAQVITNHSAEFILKRLSSHIKTFVIPKNVLNTYTEQSNIILSYYSTKLPYEDTPVS